MENANMKYKEPEIRQLVERFFEADLSPDEEMRLLLFAKKFAENIHSSRPFNEGQISADLLLIAALDDLKAETLAGLAASTPPTLERSLDAHISSLAAKEKRKAILPTWLRFTAAAAVLALVAITALRITDFNSCTHPGQSAVAELSNVRSYSTSTKSSYENRRKIDNRQQITEANKTNTSKQTKKDRHHTVSTAESRIPETVTMALASVRINEQEIPQLVSALSAVPAISEEVIEATEAVPLVATAKAEANRVLLQPITTLGQSIDNVSESVAVMSEAFAGIASSFDAVNSSLAVLKEPALSPL